MSNKSINLTPALYDYLLAVSLREPAVLARLREETSLLPVANMQISPDQGQFMRMLIHITGARRIIEIGTFTGYSAISMALGLPSDGRLLACDVSTEWTDIARRYFAEAGVAKRIELRIAPAMSTLDALLAAGEAGRFDFAFIDADKESYGGYYERVLELLRPGGLVAVDNVLWNGAVIDTRLNDEATTALREFNRRLAADDRIDLSMLPLADGLTLALKR
jgi:caffeoyl-CoA O-methyltransferase